MTQHYIRRTNTGANKVNLAITVMDLVKWRSSIHLVATTTA